MKRTKASARKNSQIPHRAQIPVRLVCILAAIVVTLCTLRAAISATQLKVPIPINNSMLRLPTLFVAHGGGPLPVLSDAGHRGLTKWLQHLPTTVPKPTALLVVSAHYEESVATVTSGPHPELIYDYYGFPPASYTLKYPAPGDPHLAQRVTQLLGAAGIESKQDPSRGFDHGAFIPLLLAYPHADIPTVELSLLSSLDPEQHIKIGEALAPLREEGVLILGSGLSFHNMAAFKGAMAGHAVGVDPKSKEFDSWLQRTLTDGTISWEQRRAALVAWKNAPEARYAHPREEHLLPLMVAFGAGKGDAAKIVFSEPLLGAQVSSIQFG